MRFITAILVGTTATKIPQEAHVPRIEPILRRRHRRLGHTLWEQGSGSLPTILANLDPAHELLVVWVGEGLPEWKDVIIRLGIHTLPILPSLAVMDLTERPKPLVTGDILLDQEDRSLDLFRLGYHCAGGDPYGHRGITLKLWTSRPQVDKVLPKLRFLAPALDATPGIVRYCFEAYADRDLNRSEICLALQAEGVPSPGGAITWSHSTILRLLTDPLAIGTNRRGGLQVPDVVLPLVSKALFYRAQARFWGESPSAPFNEVHL